VLMMLLLPSVLHVHYRCNRRYMKNQININLIRYSYALALVGFSHEKRSDLN